MFEEVLRYLGWRGQTLDDKLRGEIGAAIEEARSLALPRHIWRVFPLSGRSVLSTQLVLAGNSVERILDGAHSVALMAATLGQTLDSALSRYSRFDVSHALLLDAAATALIESVCDGAEAEIRQHAVDSGLYALPRFSPGYGDLPLSVQPMLLSVLDAGRRLGMTSTNTHLLIPRKSVTAIMPLSPESAVRALTASICADCSGGGDCPWSSCVKSAAT